MNPDSTIADVVRETARKLAEYFVPEDVRYVPIGKPYAGKCPVAAFVDARTVCERLNSVMTLAGWQDEYETLAQGEVRCRLALKLGGEWIHRCDVGSMSEQGDIGDRCKGAHSDALKRAAVKFGVGLYLHRIKNLYGAHDGHKITSWPTLPTWAIPEECQPCGEQLGGRIMALVQQASAKARCQPGDAVKRLLARYDYTPNTVIGQVQKRHARGILQDVNEWIADLVKPPQPQVGQKSA